MLILSAKQFRLPFKFLLYVLQTLLFFVCHIRLESVQITNTFAFPTLRMRINHRLRSALCQ